MMTSQAQKMTTWTTTSAKMASSAAAMAPSTTISPALKTTTAARAKDVDAVAVEAAMDWMMISLMPRTMTVAAKDAAAVVAAVAMVLRPNVRIGATATATMSVLATGIAMTIAGAIVTGTTAVGTVTAIAAVIVIKQMPA